MRAHTCVFRRGRRSNAEYTKQQDNCKHNLVGPVESRLRFGHTESSRSTPTIGSSTVNTNPRPSASPVCANSRATSTDAHVSGSVVEANDPVVGSTEILVFFQSRSFVRQQSHGSYAKRVSGRSFSDGNGDDVSMLISILYK